MTSVSMILNPAAGRVQRAPDLAASIEAALRKEDIRVQPEFTKAPGDAAAIAKRVARRGDPFVIVCGGDGTINEALQGLVGTQTALAVWPAGTANVLAKELDLPADEKSLARMISAGHRRRVSVGKAFKPDTGWQRYFVLMAGIGLDAEIVRGVDPRIKKVSGYGAYLISALGFLARLPLEPFSVTLNGQTFDATFACISNVVSYAGGFTLTPEAALEEPNLDVCIFNSRSRLQYINHALRGLSGSHTKQESVRYTKTVEIIADAPSPVPVQLDGEVVGSLPMRFECIPAAMDVISPQTSALQVPLHQSLNGEAFQRSTPQEC